MREDGRWLRVAGAILLVILGGRRGPEPARADGPAPAGAPAAAPAAAKPAPGKGTLSGVVRTASGPAAGARVIVYRHEIPVADRLGRSDEDAFAARYLRPTSVEPTVPEVVADREGRFRIEALPVGTYEVLARAADGASVGRHWPAAVAIGREERAVIALGPPATLAGKVTHVDGRPFQGYVFASFEADGSMVPLPHGGIPTRIAPDGTYRFDALPSSPCWVYAVSPGRAAALAFGGRFHGTWKPGSRVDLVVDAAAKPLEVLVADAGTHVAIPGATVRSFSREDLTYRWSEATTGADGKATLRGWDNVRATAPGYVPEEKEKLEAAAVTLEMRRGRSVRGVVRGPDRAPVAGVPVHVVGASDYRIRSTRSGPTGAYEVTSLPAAALGIVAFGDGWVPADALALAKEQSGAVALDLTTKDAASVDLTVVRGGSARILVQSIEQKPIAGASVSVGTPSTGQMGTPIWMSDLLVGDPAVTAADGSVLLAGLIPGFSYPVNATATGFVSAGAEVVPSAEVVASATLTLRPGRTITVRVTERGTGSPIPDAEVVVYVAREPGAQLRQGGQERTGVDGRVVFEGLPRSAAACAVHAPRHLTTREVSRDIPDSASDARDLVYDVELERGVSVRGRIRRADGKPLYIPSVKADPVEAAGVPSDRPWRTGDVEADGTFLLEGLAPGRYRLEAQDLLEEGQGDSIDAALEVAAGSADVEITLPRPPAPEALRRPRLLVLTPDGKPVARASAEVWSGGNSVSGSRVRDGILELDPWSGSTLEGIRVDIAFAEDAEGHALPFGPAHFGPGAGGAREAEVRLPPGVVAEGRVVDPDGRPVAGVGITARPEAVDADGNPAWRLRWHGTAKTGSDGRFVFVGLAAEPYSFELEVPRGLAAGPRVLATAPASDILIRIDRSVDVILTVLDASGVPAVGATVTAQAEGAAHHSSVKGIVDAAGHARLVGLHPTRPYALEIEPAGSAKGALTFRREGWVAREETFTLAGAATVSGTIVDEDGRPWPGASVRWWVDGKEQRDVFADAAGRFVLGGLRPGEIILSAFGGEGRGNPEPELEGPRKTVTAGATDVTLTAKRGVELVVRLVAPDPGAWRDLRAWVSRLDPKDPLGRKTFDVAIGPDGTFRSGPLVSGAPYAIWVPVGRTGLVALKTDVRGTDGELVLTPVPGQTIRGRVVADKALIHPFRWIDAYGIGWNLRVHLDAEGRFELGGVPEGTCVLRGEATIGETYYTGTVRDVRPGGADVEVRIVPEK